MERKTRRRSGRSASQSAGARLVAGAKTLCRNRMRRLVRADTCAWGMEGVDKELQRADGWQRRKCAAGAAGAGAAGADDQTSSCLAALCRTSRGNRSSTFSPRSCRATHEWWVAGTRAVVKQGRQAGKGSTPVNPAMPIIGEAGSPLHLDCLLLPSHQRLQARQRGKGREARGIQAPVCIHSQTADRWGVAQKGSWAARKNACQRPSYAQHPQNSSKETRACLRSRGR